MKKYFFCQLTNEGDNIIALVAFSF